MDSPEVDIAAAALAILAILLAWPVPMALARATWPLERPALALALWQAVAVIGGASMLGSLVTFAAAPGGNVMSASTDLAHSFAGPIPNAYGLLNLLALGIAVALAVHLTASLVLTAARAERERRRHRRLIALLGDALPGVPRTVVLATDEPIAYCIPGMRTHTVLTDGLLDLLGTHEVEAVLAHERAHLRQLHHLVLLAFRAWHTALPWFPISSRAERAVTTLTEMLADDSARQATDDRTLRRALEMLGAGTSAAYAGGVSADRTMLQQRLARLK